MKLEQRGFIRLWLTLPESVIAKSNDEPTMEVFLPSPEKATGASCVIFPGGGYRMLANYEGETPALWLAEHGITCFVVYYRLGPVHVYPSQIQDARRAVRLVRSYAPHWGLDPERIGVLGFSAGGHLAAMVATGFTVDEPLLQDDLAHIPAHANWQVLIYPVISFVETYRPVMALLGDNLQPETAVLENLSIERYVTRATPSAFLVHSTEDTVVPPLNSDLYAARLHAMKVPYEYVRGPYGQHGGDVQAYWQQPCQRWLGNAGMVVE